MMVENNELPNFFIEEKQLYSKEKGTHSFLIPQYQTFVAWFHGLPCKVLKTSSYQFFKKDGDTLMINMGEKTPGTTITQGKEFFTICNNITADNQFRGEDEISRRREALDYFVDFINVNLYLVQAVLHNSFENVQRALIAGAMPDFPFFRDEYKSLLHFCYAAPGDRDSLHNIARELMYWGADTASLDSLLKPADSFFWSTSEEQQQAKDDISQVQEVIAIINKKLEKSAKCGGGYYEEKYPIMYLMKTYAESGTVFKPPQQEFASSMVCFNDCAIIETDPDTGEKTMWYSLKWQLQTLKIVLDPKYIDPSTKSPIDKKGLFYGLAQFLLDPVKRNIFIHFALHPKSYLLSRFPARALWTKNGFACDETIYYQRHFEVALQKNDLKKIKQMVSLLRECKKDQNNVLFNDWLSRIAKNDNCDMNLRLKYEVILLLAKGQTIFPPREIIEKSGYDPKSVFALEQMPRYLSFYQAAMDSYIPQEVRGSIGRFLRDLAESEDENVVKMNATS